MHKSIADALLIRTNHAITALVSLDENGEILAIALYDTHWRREDVCAHPDAAALWLISHHPEGCEVAYAQDDANAKHFGTMSGLPVRLWIASEYFPGMVTACKEDQRAHGRRTDKRVGIAPEYMESSKA
ncbi:MAG: hypothetical protein E7321_10115 [Clostridiales bacterium]|nr:hypothetical protein [Clostridiales bacterium]